MTDLVHLFLDNLVPVFIIAGAGFIIKRALKIDPRPISQVSFYIFLPCLVFNLFTQNGYFNTDLLWIVLFTFSLIILLLGLSWLVGKGLKLERKILAAFLLSSVFMNAGNYGMPVVLFAFGEEALSHASMFFITNAMIMYTVGIVVASMGSASITRSMANLVKIPAVYALVLSFLFIQTGWQAPQWLMRTTKLLGDGTIPCLILLLGMQFESMEWSARKLPVISASAIRLLASPVIALALTILFGLTGASQKALLIEASMPTAIMSILLATEYDAEPAFVTQVALITFLLSPLTLTPILHYLGA